MEKIPPFHIGQKVVVVVADAGIKKGDTYTVSAVTEMCCGWAVAVGLPAYGAYSATIGVCSECNNQFNLPTQELYYPSDYFRAITEDFQAITFEKVVEEELASMN